MERGGPVTVKTLMAVLRQNTSPPLGFNPETLLPDDKHLAEKFKTAMAAGDDCAVGLIIGEINKSCYTEVYPRILIGNRGSVKDVDMMKKSGITHLLNMAHREPSVGKPRDDALIIDFEALKKANISYKGIKMSDLHDFGEIPDHGDQMMEGVNFIHETLKSSKSAKIMVNCYAGLSRSATTICAYLVVKEGMAAPEALKLIRAKRSVWPRKQQLAYLSEIHNRVHGFSGISVMDDGPDEHKNMLRKIVLKSQ